MKKAAASTAQQQAALAATDKARLEAKKVAELAEQKKRVAEAKAIEERRKDREMREKKRKEEEERKRNELPKTTNAYGLKQERIKRGLDPDGKDDPPPVKKVRLVRYKEGGTNALPGARDAELTTTQTPLLLSYSPSLR